LAIGLFVDVDLVGRSALAAPRQVRAEQRDGLARVRRIKRVKRAPINRSLTMRGHGGKGSFFAHARVIDGAEAACHSR
jgi:hypothetical protein